MWSFLFKETDEPSRSWQIIYLYQTILTFASSVFIKVTSVTKSLDEAKTLVYKYFNCKGIRTICEVIITGEVDSFTFWVKADEGNWSSITLRARQVGVPSTTPSWQWTMWKHWLTETDWVLWGPGNLLEQTCYHIKAICRAADLIENLLQGIVSFGKHVPSYRICIF